jgi:type II secretory pathway component PulC
MFMHHREGEKGCWRMHRLETFVLALSLSACGAASQGDMSHKEQVPSPSPRAAAPARTQEHALARSAVRAVVDRGLGAFLQHVDIDDQPVFVQGRFHGFSVAKLSDPGFWAGVDIKPGDVVVSINGLPIERPEQAQAAFDSLATASELRVALERDGQARELVYAIVDDR